MIKKMIIAFVLFMQIQRIFCMNSNESQEPNQPQDSIASRIHTTQESIADEQLRGAMSLQERARYQILVWNLQNQNNILHTYANHCKAQISLYQQQIATLPDFIANKNEKFAIVEQAYQTEVQRLHDHIKLRENQLIACKTREITSQSAQKATVQSCAIKPRTQSTQSLSTQKIACVNVLSQDQINQKNYDAATKIQSIARMHSAYKHYTQLKKEKRKQGKKLRIELDRQEKTAQIAREQQATQEQAAQHAAQERECQRVLRQQLCAAAATKYTNQCIDQALSKITSQASAQQLPNVPTSSSKNAAKNAKKRSAKKLAQQESELDEDTINWQRLSQEKHPLDEYVKAHQIFTTWLTARDKKIKDLTSFYSKEYARIFKGEKHSPQHKQDYLVKKCEEQYFNTYMHERRAKIALHAYEDLLQIFWDVSLSEFTSLANEVKSGLEESHANLQDFKQNLAWHLHMNEDQHNRINNYLKWSKIKQNEIYQELEEAIARKDPRYSPDEIQSQSADKYERIKSLDAFASLHVNNYCLDISAFQDPQKVHEAMNKGNIATKELRAAEKRIRTILETENESTAHLSIAPILDRLLTIAQITSSQNSTERIIHPSVIRCNELYEQYRLKNNLEYFATPPTTQALHRCLFDLFKQLNTWQEHPYTAEQIADEAKINMAFCKPYIATQHTRQKFL